VQKRLQILFDPIVEFVTEPKSVRFDPRVSSVGGSTGRSAIPAQSRSGGNAQGFHFALETRAGPVKVDGGVSAA